MAVLLFVKPPAPTGVATSTEQLLLTFPSSPNKNGIYYKVGDQTNFGWYNWLYSSYYFLVPPGYYGGTIETWSFWDSDQSNPDIPFNPSTNPNFIPTSGWSEPLTITPITFINTATTNLITAGAQNNYPQGAEFPRQGNNYFGDYSDDKIVWNGAQWQIRGDNNSLLYSLTALNQTVDRIPSIGVWYQHSNFSYNTFYFVGT